jgi:hypothetical protein
MLASADEHLPLALIEVSMRFVPLNVVQIRLGVQPNARDQFDPVGEPDQIVVGAGSEC